MTQHVAIPDGPNRARRQNDGVLVLRLSADEHVIISDLEARSQLPATLKRTGSLMLSVCVITCRAPKAIVGSRLLVNVHLRCWPRYVVSTCGSTSSKMVASLARINAVIVCNDLGPTPAFYVLADSASADYLWPCLVDPLREFEGAIVGLAALRALI